MKLKGKTGGSWSKIVEFNKGEYIHKFSARAIQFADPSFVLKHEIISIDGTEKYVNKFIFAIYDINVIERYDVSLFIDHHKDLHNYKDILTTNLLYYINRRKKILEKVHPRMTNEELYEAVKSSKNRFSADFIIYSTKEGDKGDRKVRISLANIEIYSKKYYLVAVQIKTKDGWDLKSISYGGRAFKLVDAKNGIINVPDAIFHYSNGKLIASPVFIGYENGYINGYMRKKLEELVNVAIDYMKEKGKEKPFLKLRTDYRDYDTYVYGIPKYDKTKLAKELRLDNESWVLPF